MIRTVTLNGRQIAPIGLGTWQFGAREWGWRDADDGNAAQIVRRALELGANFIDTAEIYGWSRSERLIGAALPQESNGAVIATKFFPVWPTAARIRRSAARSLKRLRRDVLDLYQVHWRNPLFPLAGQMRALGALQRAGRIRMIGVSNFGLAGWQAAERALGGPVVSNQVHYNLLDRRCERALLPWARQNGRLIIAYSPLAQGLLSGKYADRPRPRDVRKFYRWFSPRLVELARPTLALLREIAAGKRATCAQVALAWLIHRGGVIAIPGARHVRQLEENAAAGALQLEDDELEALCRASAEFHERRGVAIA